jgi:outer membrane receptor protein involved in Fe transport
MKIWMTGAAVGVMALAASTAWAQSETQQTNTATEVGEIVVTGQAKTYAAVSVSEEMIRRQAPMASVNEVVNELPGVHVTEADFFGSADFHTAITMRGFNSGMGAQQIGTTIDGLPNGGSDYGGGSRANRYFDMEDLGTVEVSQGTADIGSRSNEALGGTLNFLSSDPLKDQRIRLSAAIGDQSAKRFYGRFDTGEFLPDTFAFVSASSTRHNDWVDDATRTTRDHATAKVVSKQGGFDLTGFLSWDKVNEAEYASQSLADFNDNPRRDPLLADWTGIPYYDQNSRDVSRALRENIFTYLRAERRFGEVKVQATGYYHSMRGQGDFAPPYIINLVADGAGAPESELTPGNVFYGGSSLTEDRNGTSSNFIYYVDAQGRYATPRAGCVGRLGMPTAADPACYDGAVTPVSSYRHTHYRNKRYGMTADAAWDRRFGDFDNTLRAGLWVEHYSADATRDWHRIINPLLGDTYEGDPYWVQYATQNTTDEVMYYVEDVLRYGPFAFRAGVKQFFIDYERAQPIGDETVTTLNADSEPQWSFGASWDLDNGVELFTGWSRNFNAISVGRLSSNPVETAALEPETARNIEVGARIRRGPLQGSLLVYDIEFENRITFVPTGVGGGDGGYLDERDGTYVNLGGIKSRGVEGLVAYDFDNGWKVSGSYTYNDAVYSTTGNDDLDNSAGIKDGGQVFGSPKTMYVASVDYDGGYWRAGLSAKRVGERFIDFAGEETAPGYTLVNASFGASLGEVSSALKGFEASVTVNNLTDITFVNGVTGGGVYAGAPRTVVFAVTADF